MQFLVEATDFSDVKILSEGTGTEKHLFIEGIFAQAEKKNRNGRIYPKQIMESAVKAYNDGYVSKRRALGEISHPENRPQVKPELSSHLITEFRMDGNDVYGKARVLTTPQGQILKGLLDGGVQMGVSTRGLGSVLERAGSKYVNDDYLITAVDAVTDPSALDAWVNAVNESQEWLVTDDGRVIEQVQKTIKKNKLNESQMYELMQQFFRTIKQH